MRSDGGAHLPAAAMKVTLTSQTTVNGAPGMPGWRDGGACDADARQQRGCSCLLASVAWKLARRADVINLHHGHSSMPLILLDRQNDAQKPVVLTYQCDLRLPHGLIHAIANQSRTRQPCGCLGQ